MAECVLDQPNEKSTLLSLPTEILATICSFATLSGHKDPSAPYYTSWEQVPECKLRKRFQRLSVCKQLYEIARTAHWSENWCFAYIDIAHALSEKTFLSAGTFRESDYYFTNTQKLRIFVSVDTTYDVQFMVTRVKSIVENCSALSHLILDVSMVEGIEEYPSDDESGTCNSKEAVQAKVRTLVAEEVKKAVRKVAMERDKQIQMSVVERQWTNHDVVTAEGYKELIDVREDIVW